jgi:hypothetical protein
MLYVDIPTLSELRALIAARADACLSIYVSATPQTQHVGAASIAYGNLLKAALKQLEDSGLNKRRRALIEAECDALKDDDAFWAHQANSLAVLATPDSVRTFRLATAVKDSVEVSDRFQLKPLLRAVAFPQTAFVLALSDNAVRLVEVFPDMPASVVKVPGHPKSAADAVGRASVRNLTQNTRLSNAEGQKALLRQFARQVDSALRPVLAGRHTPLILASTQPMDGLFRGLNSYPHLLREGISGSPDKLSEGELAAAARPVLDTFYKTEVAAAKAEYQKRLGDRRATTNLDEIARAATNGGVSQLMIDMEKSMPGNVSDIDGSVTLASGASAGSYDVLDEIAGRALLSGATFFAVRQADMPDGAPLAAILRYPI